MLLARKDFSLTADENKKQESMFAFIYSCVTLTIDSLKQISTMMCSMLKSTTILNSTSRQLCSDATITPLIILPGVCPSFCVSLNHRMYEPYEYANPLNVIQDWLRPVESCVTASNYVSEKQKDRRKWMHASFFGSANRDE